MGSDLTACGSLNRTRTSRWQAPRKLLLKPKEPPLVECLRPSVAYQTTRRLVSRESDERTPPGSSKRNVPPALQEAAVAVTQPCDCKNYAGCEANWTSRALQSTRPCCHEHRGRPGRARRRHTRRRLQLQCRGSRIADLSRPLPRAQALAMQTQRRSLVRCSARSDASSDRVHGAERRHQESMRRTRQRTDVMRRSYRSHRPLSTRRRIAAKCTLSRKGVARQKSRTCHFACVRTQLNL